MSGSVETRTKRSYAEREFGARLALDAERRPPTFWRRPHGRHACACGRQLGAALRPRARTGSLPQTCEVSARCRPSTDCVGVLAGARPADGPDGCSPSAPSWRRSAGRSSLLRRRIRCLPTPLARLALPPRSPPTGCSLCMAGDHWTLRWKLFFMAAKRQRAAVAWRRAGARAVRRAHASVCTEAREGPRSRSGRRLVVEPADPRCLAGPPGPTAELGGL